MLHWRERLIAFFYTTIFFVPGTLIIAYVVYSSLRFQVDTKGFTKAYINYLESSELDSGKTVNYYLIDQNGKELTITQPFTQAQQDNGQPLFAERRVRVDPHNPTKLYAESNWFGIFAGIVFGGIFMTIGYSGLRGINVLRKPKQLFVPITGIAFLLLGTGLLAEYLATLQKDNSERFKYEYIAILLILIGTSIIYYWLRLQQMFKQLDKIGNVVLIKQLSIEVDTTVAGWISTNNYCLNESNELIIQNQGHKPAIKAKVEADSDFSRLGINPFVITCKHMDDKGKEHTFKSQYIWFDPAPFINGEIKVLVHPKNWQCYAIDYSFLPQVSIPFRRISYNRQ